MKKELNWNFYLKKLEEIENLENLTPKEFINSLWLAFKEPSIINEAVTEFSTINILFKDSEDYTNKIDELCEIIMFIDDKINNLVSQEPNSPFNFLRREVSKKITYVFSWACGVDDFKFERNSFHLLENAEDLVNSILKRVFFNEKLESSISEFFDRCNDLLNYIVQKNKDIVVIELMDVNQREIHRLLDRKLSTSLLDSHKYLETILFLSEENTILDLVKKKKELRSDRDDVEKLIFILEGTDIAKNKDIVLEISEYINQLGKKHDNELSILHTNF